MDKISHSRTFSFHVPGALPARNESELAARSCWQAGSGLKKKHTKRVEMAARRWRDVAWVPMERFKVRVLYRCKDRRRDPDNILGGLKYILDGCREAGIIRDDRWKNVAEIDQSWTLDPEAPGVDVCLSEVDK